MPLRSRGLAPRVLVVVAASLGITASSAQEPPASPSPVFSVGLDVVEVSVSVWDRQGKLLTDLKAEDFIILEDGRPQKIALFARAVEPEAGQSAGSRESLALTLGLLMDTSESMLKELKLSQQAAVHFLDTIPRARDLLTIFFAHDIRISRYDSENQQGLFDRIMEAKGGGNTALYDSIAVYLSRVGDATGRKVLVLFTDGEDSISETSLSEVRSLIRSSPVTIYSIAFLGGFRPGSSSAVRSRAFLQDIADMTGGSVFTPTSFRDLDTIYKKILDELAGQYVLGFVPDSAHKDGRYRRLKVQVRGKDVKVHHRSGYAVAKEEPETRH